MNNEQQDGDLAQTCAKAISIARQGEALHWELAQLLVDIKEKESWRSVGATSFKQFLQDHVRLAESTARQLIKVHRMCEEQAIPREKVEELGWSKLAEVAAHVTPDNKESVLGDVANLSLAKLRDKYRNSKAKDLTANGQSKQRVVWTEEIQEALRQAARFTRSNELQVNLQFIAQKFQTLMPFAPDRDIRFSRN